MPFKHRVDRQLLRVRQGDQRVRGLVRPIQRQRRRVGYEPRVERDIGVHVHHLITHTRPGQVVDPGRVRVEELRRARGDPFGEAVVVFLRGGDLPAHDEEHNVQHGDLLGEGGEVGEGPDDVGEDFGERVREGAAVGVEERGDGGVGRADEVLAGDAFGGAALALGKEVEEEAVERAGGADVADGGVGAGGGGVVVVAFGCEDGVGGQLRVAGDGGL